MDRYIRITLSELFDQGFVLYYLNPWFDQQFKIGNVFK